MKQRLERTIRFAGDRKTFCIDRKQKKRRESEQRSVALTAFCKLSLLDRQKGHLRQLEQVDL